MQRACKSVKSASNANKPSINCMDAYEKNQFVFEICFLSLFARSRPVESKSCTQIIVIGSVESNCRVFVAAKYR